MPATASESRQPQLAKLRGGGQRELRDGAQADPVRTDDQEDLGQLSATVNGGQFVRRRQQLFDEENLSWRGKQVACASVTLQGFRCRRLARTISLSLLD